METHALLSLVPLFAMLCCAAATDLRSRRIPNWLTFSMILTGIAQSCFMSSHLTPAQAGQGLLAGLGLTFILFAIGALGGGDVKLLAGVGAWIGVAGVVFVFASAAIIGMMMVLCQSLAQGRLRILLRNSAMVAVNVMHVDAVGVEHVAETGKSCRSVDRPLPYAVPVLVGVVLLLMGRALWNG